MSSKCLPPRGLCVSFTHCSLCRRSVSRLGDSAFSLCIVHCVAAVSPVSGLCVFFTHCSLCRRSVSRLGDSALFLHIVHSSNNPSPQRLPFRGLCVFSTQCLFIPLAMVRVVEVSPVSGTLRFLYALFILLTMVSSSQYLPGPYSLILHRLLVYPYNRKELSYADIPMDASPLPMIHDKDLNEYSPVSAI